MARFVALLRGINVGGHHRVAMAELRALCESLGWRNVATYIQSGNVVFDATGRTTALANALRDTLASDLGVEVPIVVSAASAWSKALQDNPWPSESDAHPTLVHMGLGAGPLAATVVEALAAYRGASERIERRDGVLWVFYANGVGRSRLTPARLDRAAGVPMTLRNWRSASKIQSML